jgi:hypothetical protein
VTWRFAVALATSVFLVGSTHTFAQQRAEFPVRPAVDSLTADSLAPAGEERGGSLARSTVSVWGAGSVQSGEVIGTMPRGWFGLVGIRYHRLLIPRTEFASHDGPTLTYTADVVPMASVVIPEGTPPGAPAPDIQSVAETGLSTAGVGGYPLGLRVGFRPSSPIRPFIAGHTGFFYLFEPVPDERGRHVNFAVGVGGGVTISFAHRITLTLGYRYHHLSNGFRGSINPGLDANLLYLGVGLSP